MIHYLALSVLLKKRYGCDFARKIATYFRDVRRYNIKILRMPDEMIFRTLPVYAYLATNSTHYKMSKTDINISVDLSF